MSFDLIEDLIGKYQFYPMIMMRIDQHVRVLENQLLNLSHFRFNVDPLVQDQLKRLLDGGFSTVCLFTANKIFMDLYTSYKQDDCRFRVRADLIKLLELTYIKYAQYINLVLSPRHS